MENLEEEQEEREYLVKRHLFIKRAAILLAAICIFCLIWVIFVLLNNEAESEDMDSGLKNLFVTHISSGSAKYTSEEIIQWWHNETDDKYYMFLPASANLKALKLGLDGVDYIYMDGKKIKNTKRFQVSLGEHTVTTDADDKSYQLVFMQSANLPAAFISTESGNMENINASKENREGGTVLIMDENGDAVYVGPLEYIKGRGNVTWENSDKKGYHIKLPKKEDLFGMGEAKDWVLLANDFDASMLRNTTTYDFAAKSGVAFTTESTFMDIYMNGQYWGTYQLCEKVEVDSTRVDIPDLLKETENANPGIELSECDRFGTENVQDSVTVAGTMMGYEIPENPSDITGGYLLELEIGGRYVHETAGFVTARNRAVVIQSPKYASREQTSYIADLYQEFEDAVYEFDGINPNTGKAYYEYIDVDSFAKKYLVEEITKNLDAMISSQYIYKYPDRISNKLYAGPAWDYDSAIGNGMASGSIVDSNGEIDLGKDTTSPIGLYAMSNRSEAPIWYALYYRPEFQEALKRNYKEVFRQNVLDEVEYTIDQNADRIVDSNIMNTIRWSKRTAEEKESIRKSYFESVAEVKKFLKDRIEFLDQEWR